MIARLREEGREHLDLKTDRAWLSSLSAQPELVIHKLRRKGVLHTIQRGRYVLNTDATASRRPILRSLDPLAPIVLEQLAHPYFLSWHSALWQHGLLDQQSQRLFVAMTARKRRVVQGRLQVRFVTIDERKFFGYEPRRIEGFVIPVATAGKALLDSLDMPRHAGPVGIVAAALRTAWRQGLLEPDQLVGDALRFESAALNRRLGFFMDFYDIPGSDGLLPHLGRHWAVTLNPGSKPDLNAASVNSKWRVWPDPDVVAVARSQR